MILEYNPENVDGTFDSGNHTKAFDGEKINGSALGLAIIQWTKTDSRGSWYKPEQCVADTSRAGELPA